MLLEACPVLEDGGTGGTPILSGISPAFKQQLKMALG
jgi:hypothetical protein